MSTAEAAVATLTAHGLDTVYALPGIHNDHLFDAFQRASENLRVVHTRHEQGAAYMALGAALSHREAANLLSRSWTWPAQFQRCSSDGIWNERAGPCAHRANSRGGNWESARSPP